MKINRKNPKITAVSERSVTEDAVTAKLAALIGSNEEAKQLFLRFLFDQGTADQLSRAPLGVELQHRTPHGKIDLLLHNPEVGIIVESKVDDRHKIFQLESYYDWWLGKTGKAPFAFWLVRRTAVGLGRNDFLTRELTWNQLYDYLKSGGGKLNDASSRKAINTFCGWLATTGVLIKPGDKTTVLRRNKGYSYERAEEVLETVAASFCTKKYRVVPPENELPHRLVLGRESWSRKFGSERVDRVWIYYRPHRGPDGQTTFYFSPAIVFWNRKYRTGLEFALQQFPEWAAICSKHGMRMWRNKPGKWVGVQNLEITAPYRVSSPVNYFFADDERLARDRFKFDPGAKNEVEVEIACMERYLQIVDSF